MYAPSGTSRSPMRASRTERVTSAARSEAAISRISSTTSSGLAFGIVADHDGETRGYARRRHDVRLCLDQLADLLGGRDDVLVVGQEHDGVRSRLLYRSCEVGGARVLALAALDHDRPHLLEEVAVSSPAARRDDA